MTLLQGIHNVLSNADRPAVDDSSANHDAAIAQAACALALSQLHGARLKVVDGGTRGNRADSDKGSKSDSVNDNSMCVNETAGDCS
jgi:hypothetical protein